MYGGVFLYVIACGFAFMLFFCDVVRLRGGAFVVGFFGCGILVALGLIAFFVVLV